MLSHRQVSEAARFFRGLWSERGIRRFKRTAPSGIRLLPDPAFPIQRLADGSIDPSKILAASQIIPIAPAPEYSEGFVNINFLALNTLKLPYPGDGGGSYPFPSLNNTPLTGTGVLMVEESVYDPNTGLPNAPTSWFWNIRVGEKIQLNKAGIWYTIVGPMTTTPATGNPEMFVNVGPPGTVSPLKRLFVSADGKTVIVDNPDFLFLVNGRDDNNNGWCDEGWDGSIITATVWLMSLPNGNPRIGPQPLVNTSPSTNPTRSSAGPPRSSTHARWRSRVKLSST